MLLTRFQEFLSLLLVPISFLPTSVVIFLNWVICAFALFVVCKLFKLIWDALPIV